MSIKVGMVSLGCPKNQTDAEIMLSLLKEGGYEITGDENAADVIIVNTCGFIADAKQEAIDNILELAELKKAGSLKSIIVTGCMAERYRDEILSEMPEVDAVVGIGSNKNICSVVKNVIGGCKYSEYGEKTDLLMDNARILTSPSYTAYIRIADGCDNKCTYCAIPMIRGGFRSRTIESVVEEAKALAQGGVKELVLIAQDTTRYGEDLYGKSALSQLLTELCTIDGIRWIRILYTYPERITDELIDVMASNDKILKYLDIPMQHASDNVLKRMNRKSDNKSLRAIIQKLRSKMPDITIRTTFIVGFPGETEEDFATLCEFVKDMKFNRAGCFTYSEEEGTPAAEFDGKIDEQIKQDRYDILMTEQSVVNEQLLDGIIGKQITVLIEGYDSMNKCHYGRSEMDAPEIDGKVFIVSKTPKYNAGDFVECIITDTLDYDLLAESI